MHNIIEISPKVTLLQAKNSFLNSTVIEGEKSLLIIDTLLLPKDSKELYQFCLTKNKPVKYIINTHWHSDHCYGNRFFDSFSPLIIAQNYFLNTIESEKNVIAPNKANIINKDLLRFPNITFSKEIRIPEFDLIITHAPGHSYDSTRIYSTEEDLYWTGDNLLNSNDNKIAIPYFFWGDPDAHLRELKNLAKEKPRKIIPGHGLPCGLEKLEKDIIYIQNLLFNFSKIPSQCEAGQLPSIRESYPSQKDEEFWVEKMHDLNLQKLISMR